MIPRTRWLPTVTAKCGAAIGETSVRIPGLVSIAEELRGRLPTVAQRRNPSETRT